MREERLQKVRQEKSVSNSELGYDVQPGQISNSNNSPKFQNEEVNFRTLGPTHDQEDYDELESAKLQTADFSNSKIFELGLNWIGLKNKATSGERGVDIARDIVGNEKEYQSRNKSVSSISHVEDEDKFLQVNLNKTLLIKLGQVL